MMARTLLSRPSYGFLLHFENLNLFKPFLCMRNYVKKQYGYDLDSLIEWNNDTALAFGNPVKLTKTGKVRKSRKPQDEQLTHNLEMSYAMSEPVLMNESNKRNMKPKKKTENQLRNEMGENCSFGETIPECLFEDEVPYFDNNASDSSLISSQNRSKSKGTVLKEMTEDGIYIPEIKPMPQYASNNKVKHQDIESSFHRVVNPGSSINDSDFETTARAKTFSESNIKSSFQSDLPVEPPESFKLITEFPLTFDENDKVTHHMSSKLLSYQADVEKLCLRTLPSVKSILNKTMPDLNRFFLNRWRAGMVKELGEEGFKLHQEATIKRGINFHANIMEFLSGRPVSEIQVMPDNEGHWASIQPVISFVTDVTALEADVKHPFLRYRGVFDCIARYKDLLCVVDWKTSKKPRPLLKNTYDDPLQIAAYVGAVNATNGSKNPAQEINHGVIVVVYPDGSPAHVHMMNRAQCEHYWRDWTERLYNYYQLTYSAKFG